MGTVDSYIIREPNIIIKQGLIYLPFYKKPTNK